MTAEKVITYLKTRHGFQEWWNNVPETNQKIILASIDKVISYKTWREWDKERIGGIVIVDPDGFRDYPDDRLYSREEFVETRQQSTVRFNIKSGRW